MFSKEQAATNFDVQDHVLSVKSCLTEDVFINPLQITTQNI